MIDGRGIPEADPNEPFGDPVENDPLESVEEAEPYFAPTDPVIRTGRDGDTEVLGGFDDGQVPQVEPPPSADDEALRAAVRRELALDASTTHLRIGVSVEKGVVRLWGEVADAADAENAVAVAGEVPGVGEVVDALTPTGRPS